MPVQRLSGRGVALGGGLAQPPFGPALVPFPGRSRTRPFPPPGEGGLDLLDCARFGTGAAQPVADARVYVLLGMLIGRFRRATGC